jgi:hypothetical protein
MAHSFMLGRNRKRIEDNLRWVQVFAMGGDRTLAEAIRGTRLGRNFTDDEFWSTVVLFLVNNAMMDPSYVGPVVDYIHNMKFSPRRIVQEGGGVVEAPPPQPNFTMKGRSAAKLLRQVDAWHGQLNRASDVVFQSWQPSGVRPFELEDETPELGPVRWTIQELLSSWELVAEGTAMNHCVVSYSDQCADGRTTIWSVCLQREGQEQRENVLSVAIDIETRAVTQARGRYNAAPNKPPRSAKARAESKMGYFEMLNRSDYVLGLWIEHENLRRSD